MRRVTDSEKARVTRVRYADENARTRYIIRAFNKRLALAARLMYSILPARGFVVRDANATVCAILITMISLRIQYRVQ